MADIRKRVGKNGTTYQVRYPSKKTKSGYAFKTFKTRKAARAFLESGKVREAHYSEHHSEIQTVDQAVDLWLRICEKEGLNGREPVTAYTYFNYEYRAQFVKNYGWTKALHEIRAPDVVAFRSWLLQQDFTRSTASKVMSTFQSIMKEMTIRGVLPYNVATGITIRSDSRYAEPVSTPTKKEIIALLSAADRLANSKDHRVAKAWERYRPILYLAVDSGMRPQEYLALSRASVHENGVFVDRAIDGMGMSLSVTKTYAGRRFIETSPETLDMIRYYIEHHTIENKYDLVFPVANGRWLCRRNWKRRGFNEACLEAGLYSVTEKNGKTVNKVKYRPYDLRHFFASMLIENNVNLKKIQKLMGHSNIETTFNVYEHLLDDELDKDKEAGMLNTTLFESCGKVVAKDT